MRLASVIALLVFVAACGSGAPTSTPTGSESAVIQGGDHQSALVGTLLPAKPAVLVKDASGSPVPNVSVTFAVDSGGGSLSATSAVTGTDGLAVAGGWTLGPVAGTNVVSATVAGLPVLRFHAQALGATARPIITNTLVGSGGGTLTYTRAGDALNGLTVVVPAAAYATATTWSIVADSSIVVPLPSGFSQVGPVLIIGNGLGYATSNMTLTMPMRIAATDAVAPFYFDPTSGTLEPIPMVGVTDSSATLATTHFSGDLMAIPGSGTGTAGSLRGSLRSGFGSVRMVWIRTPASRLIGTFSSSFTPGVDDWEFVNTGDYFSALGDCEGMSITEMYYHYYFRRGPSPRPGLYHQFDVSLVNPWDNVQGYHLVGSVQLDYEQLFNADVTGLQVLEASEGADVLARVRSLTVNWILLTLRLNQAPVLLGLVRPGGGHAIVAYSATSDGTNTVVSVADPNRPGEVSSLTFAGGDLAPVNFQTSVSSLAATYNEVYAVGVTAEVPLSQLQNRWSAFLNKTVGADRLPPYYFATLNEETGHWDSLGTTLLTYTNTFKASLICDACQVKTDGADPPGLMTASLYDATGASPASSTLPPGTTTFVVTGSAWSPYDTPSQFGFLDMTTVAVTSVQLSLVPDNRFPLATQPVTLTFTPTPNKLPSQVKYTWDFGDQTALVTTTNNRVVQHAYAGVGQWTVTVTATDLTTLKVFATLQTIIESSAPPVWRFTSVSLASETGPAPVVPNNPLFNVDIQALADTKAQMARVITVPGDGLVLYLGPDYRTQIGAVPNTTYDVIQLQIAATAGAGAAITRLTSTGVIGNQLGFQCTDPGCSNPAGSITTTGTTLTGTLGGTAPYNQWRFSQKVGEVFVPLIIGPWTWWSVSATKNGTTMTGTITYNQSIANVTSDAFLGTHTLTWTFTATMVP